MPSGNGWLAGLFYFFIRLGAPGLFLLGVLDSSFLMLPFANDVAVIVSVSLHHDQTVWYVLAATAGSFVGCWILFAVGHAGGESFLRTHISPQRFDRLHKMVSHKGPFLLAVPAIIPPPFPFSAFVLGAGALEVPEKPFLATMALMRFVRFLAEAIAALYWGRGIVKWLQTPTFVTFIRVLMGIAILASAYSIYRMVHTTRTHRGNDERRRNQRSQTGTK